VATVSGAVLHLRQADAGEEVGERSGAREGKPAALVEGGGVAVEGRGLVPEDAQELHALGVVPDIRGGEATRAQAVAQVRHGALGPGEEVEDQPRDGRVEPARVDRGILGARR
jgi:hypothetical protein